MTVVARQEARMDGVVNSFVIKLIGLYGTLNSGKSLPHIRKRCFGFSSLLGDYDDMILIGMNVRHKLLSCNDILYY
jgi:hypothetical protein